MTKPYVTLDNWAVIQSAAVRMFQDLQPGNVLIGTATGHQRLKDEEMIFTSRIVKVHAEGELVETKNTVYRLGQVSPEYSDWNCRQRSIEAA